MEPAIADNPTITTIARLDIHSLSGDYPMRPVPPHLAAAFAPATECLYEWTDYRLTFDGADQLRIGSQRTDCLVPGVFLHTFRNQLGLTSITPLSEGKPIAPDQFFEVLARKFPTLEHSHMFMSGILADLFSMTPSIAFATQTTTGRRVREAHRPPDLLFTYHFFRAYGHAAVRALQAIAGRPHQRLSDDGAMVRIHEVRSLDVEAITRLLTDGHGGGERRVGSGATVLQKLQPERIFQRLPEETFDTPENRFVIFAARRMLAALTRLQTSNWFQGNAGDARDRAIFDTTRAQLRLFTTDSRFTTLPQMQVFPAQSRVLQRRDGYRETMELWNIFQRASEPIFEHLSQAIDLRDVASMYELWVWFHLLETIEFRTGVSPTVSISKHALGHVSQGQSAHFAGLGSLHYNRHYTAYTSVPLRPDYVWVRPDGMSIALDAKFRLDSVDELAKVGEGETGLDGTAKNADIVKMHAYRDAIDGLAAAIVLYPGSETAFWNRDGTQRPTLAITDIVDRDLIGIGAIPCRPKSLTGPDPEEPA